MIVPPLSQGDSLIVIQVFLVESIAAVAAGGTDRRQKMQ
jgi:hypothetical protein